MRLFTLLIAFLSLTIVNGGFVRQLLKPVIDLDRFENEEDTIQNSFDRAKNITTIQRKNIVKYSLLK